MAQFLKATTLLLTVSLLMLAASRIANSQSGNGKYDADYDNLIEVSYLEQLDAIRYDLDGDGRPDSDSGVNAYTSAFPTSAGESVCYGCEGYELVRSLDFDDAGSYASETVNERWTGGVGWLPIGLDGIEHDSVFDGNGHAISNLRINRPTALSNPGAAGPFGFTRRLSVIRRVGLSNVEVRGIDRVGGLVGHSGGTISDSYVTGSVSGTDAVGGLVGGNFGPIDSSYATGSVSGNDEVGGLVGSNQDPVSSSYAIVDTSGQESTGGLAGSNYSTISDSYATGDVSGADAGGLVGYNASTITASYATGSVSGRNAGGLTAYNRGTIAASYATGSVSGRRYAGGLTATNSDRIIASYATSNVSGRKYVGGLVGGNSGVALANYWDTQTSGTGNGVGNRDSDSVGIEGKTTHELQSPTGYSGIYSFWDADLDNADGDFDPTTGSDDHWDFGTESQYPVLKADFDSDGTANWWEFGNQVGNRPTPTPTNTPTPTPTNTPTPTPTNTPTPTPTNTPTPTPTNSPTPTPTNTLTPTPTNTPTPTPTNTLTPTPTNSPTPSATPTPIPTSTPTPMPTGTPTPTVAPTHTPSPVPPTSTAEPTATREPAPTGTVSMTDPGPTSPPSSGDGACGLPSGLAPRGALLANMLLLIAPLAMIGGLKQHSRRKRATGG